MLYINQIIWGIPIPSILICIHLYFTIKTGFIQKDLFKGIRLSFTGTSPSILFTTLAATLGTGNIIGMSTAIYYGGAGAIFWCFITGLLGMATCYSECFLGVKYQDKSTHLGGPMYALKYGAKLPLLAIFFCICTILASFGVGCTTQSNSLATSIKDEFGISTTISGIICAFLCGLIITGGLKTIGKICSILVPLMSVIFMAGCFIILIKCNDYILPALKEIILGAFSKRSSLAGTCGGSITVLSGVRYGIARGLFTNEAGLGSTAITAGSSSQPSYNQGIISMSCVFWDTIIMCSITGLVMVSCALKYPLAFSDTNSTTLMNSSFSLLGNAGGIFLSICIVLFAFATLNGWCYFGECAVHFIANEFSLPLKKSLNVYYFLYTLMIFFGAILSLDTVWEMCDLFNALMLFPNILCLIILRKKVLSQEPV